MKFNRLNVPGHWQNYWTRYPEGHTILEALVSWVSQVDSMVDNQNKLNDNVEQFRNEIDEFVGRFDERLQDEVTQTLSDWQTSGFLDVVISEALQWQLDTYIVTNEQDKLTINQQLAETAREINPFSFGAVGDGVSDDRQALVDTIEYAKLNNVTVNLGTGNTYLIGSKQDTHLFLIDKRIHIKGESTIKIGAIGDYERIFNLDGYIDGSIFEDFILDVNTRGNAMTALTGNVVGSRRCDFYGANYGLPNVTPKNITFRGMEIIDTLGKWQIYLRANDVLIERINIEYTNLFNPTYDRTCLYMLGDGWTVQNSTFKGSEQANTLFETHGANQRLLNNVSTDFNASVFIANDHETNLDNLGDITVHGNTFKNRVGIRLWPELDNIDFDNIYITNNTIEVSLDRPCIQHYSRVGDNVHVNSVIIEGNTLLKPIGSTEPLMDLGITTSGGLVTYNNIIVKNNLFSGVCSNIIRLALEVVPAMSLNNLVFDSNVFDIHVLGGSLFNIIDDGYGYKKIQISNNIFKIRERASDDFYHYSVFIVNRTEGFGSILITDNVYDYGEVTGVWTFCNSSGKKLVTAKEKFLVDISTMVAQIYNGEVSDIIGNKTVYLDGVKQPN